MYKFDKLNHLHTFNGAPLLGTSSVVGVIAKPLTWWASGKALELLGWTPTKSKASDRISVSSLKLKEIKNITEKEYLALLDKAYRNHKDSLDKSASKGTDLHSEIEQYIKQKIQGIKSPKYNELIRPFVLWAESDVRRFIWSEAHCYSTNMWCGGISDFGVELTDGRIILGDIKSSKEAYISHFIQAAGYCLQILENGLLDDQGKEIMRVPNFDGICIVPFGADTIAPVFNPLPIDKYYSGFKAAVELYKLTQIE